MKGRERGCHLPCVMNNFKSFVCEFFIFLKYPQISPYLCNINKLLLMVTGLDIPISGNCNLLSCDNYRCLVKKREWKAGMRDSVKYR